MTQEIMAWIFMSFSLGVCVGIIYAPRDPERKDVDVAMERYRDKAVSVCEAQLQNFGASTQWDSMRKARAEYLTEARGIE